MPNSDLSEPNTGNVIARRVVGIACYWYAYDGGKIMLRVDLGDETPEYFCLDTDLFIATALDLAEDARRLGEARSGARI